MPAKTLAFVNPPQRWQVDPYYYPPVGLGYVHAAAAKAFPGYVCDLINASGRSPEELAGALSAYDLVAYTCTTPYYEDTYRLAALVIRHDSSTTQVIGGAHATIVPRDVSALFDAVFVGDGTKTIVEYIRAWSEGGPRKTVWRSEESLDLDTAAFPTHPIGKKLNYGGAEQTAVLYTSVGCTHNCTFCAARGVQKEIRFRSPGSIYNELCALKGRGITEVRFMDDAFTMKPSHLRAVCEKIAPIGMRWGCMARSDQVTPSILEVMKRAGCRELGYGVESFDQNVLDMLRKGTTVEENVHALEMTTAAGLNAHAFMLISTPGETYKTTVSLNIDGLEAARGQFVKINFAVFMPHLGTAVEADPDAHGVKIVNRDYSRYNQHQCVPGPNGPVLRPVWSPIRIDGMSQDQQYANIDRFRRYVYSLSQTTRGAR